MNEHSPPAAETLRDVADPLDRFVEQMGLLSQGDSKSRIAGRLFGLFIVEDGPLSLQEVAQRLKVSRASVSTNARILTHAGLLERTGVPGDRQDYYRLARDPYRNLVTGMVQKMAMAQQMIGRAAEDFPPERATARQRVEELAEFYRHAAATLAAIGERCGGSSVPRSSAD